MSSCETNEGGIARGIRKTFGSLADRTETCPKLSRMFSLTRILYAVTRSAVRSASGSAVIPCAAASWVLPTTMAQIASAVDARGIGEDFCLAFPWTMVRAYHNPGHRARAVLRRNI